MVMLYKAKDVEKLKAQHQKEIRELKKDVDREIRHGNEHYKELAKLKKELSDYKELTIKAGLENADTVENLMKELTSLKLVTSKLRLNVSDLEKRFRIKVKRYKGCIRSKDNIIEKLKKKGLRDRAELLNIRS